MKKLGFDQPVCHKLQTEDPKSTFLGVSGLVSGTFGWALVLRFQCWSGKQSLQGMVPVQRCCRRRSSSCSPFRVLACSRCRNSRFFWALCSWFFRVEVAILTLPRNRHGIVMVGYLAHTGILPLQPGSAGMAEFYCSCID